MPRLRWFVFLLGLSIFGGACGDDPSDTEEPPTGTIPPPGELPEDSEYSEHVQQIIRFVEAEAEQRFRCPSSSFIGTNSIDAYITVELATLNAYRRWMFDPEKTRIDENALASYLQLLASTCDLPQRLHDAIMVTLIGGIQNDGDTCENHHDCWGNSQCAPDPDTPNSLICTPAPVALGGECVSIDECANAGKEQIFCAIKPGEDTGSCARWEYPAPRQLNESCNTDANGYAQLCRDGLWCHRNACIEPLQNGAICGSTGSYGCLAGHFCRSVNILNTGVCLKPSNLGEGEACDSSLDHYALCNFDDGLICDLEIERCVPIDLQCIIDEDCTDGLVRCGGDLVCVGPAQIGEPCASDRHCASGNCVAISDTEMTCQAP